MSAIAGNQYYQGIVSEINSTRVTANLVGPLNGGPSQVTFIGYSPSDFSTIGTFGYMPLMTTPDTLSTVTANQLQIPANLLPIMGQIVQQGSIALANNITIGMSTLPTVGTHSVDIITLATPTNITAGTFGTPQSTSNYTRGTDTYLTVYNLGAAQTNGKFKVAITCNAVLV